MQIILRTPSKIDFILMQYKVYIVNLDQFSAKHPVFNNSTDYKIFNKKIKIINKMKVKPTIKRMHLKKIQNLSKILEFMCFILNK